METLGIHTGPFQIFCLEIDDWDLARCLIQIEWPADVEVNYDGGSQIVTQQAK